MNKIDLQRINMDDRPFHPGCLAIGEHSGLGLAIRGHLRPGAVGRNLGIAFRSIGFMGKLIGETIEATGASRLQVLWVAILPQVLPVIYGTTVYRWDINIRESRVLGFVGAGGMGILL